MEQVITKFSLKAHGEIQTVLMPVGTKIVKIDTHLGLEGSHRFPDDCLKIWALCPQRVENIERHFLVVATGAHFEDEAYDYLESVVFKASNLVYHILEKK